VLLAGLTSLLLPLMAGCMSLSTLQSPEVLPPGENRVGAGVLLGGDLEGGESGIGELAILGRRGLSENVDMGGRIWGIPPYVGLYGDLRYQIVRDPVFVSGGLGASVFHFDDFTTVGIYPTVLAGSDRLFGGIKWTQLVGGGGDVEDTFGAGFPGLVAGTGFGQSLIFSPEVINVYFGEGTTVLPGLTVQFQF
jgi:hypothetical protein